jgi:hypothetical protein
MTEPNPNTVFVAENITIAEAVIQLLSKNNIDSEAFTEATQTISEPVTGVSEMSQAEHIEIRVLVPTKADEARALLNSVENAAIVQSIREKRKQRTGTVTAVCEECGKSSDWPAEEMGTVANCPSCGAFMDIPDPDDDWSGVDFGEAEDETPE